MKPTTRILLYIFAFFSASYPIYPLYALMFADTGNLSSDHIALLFFLWFLFALVWEVPSGIIADRYSRKYTVMVSYALTVSTFVVWLFVPTFVGFLLGFLLWGLGYALYSGAWDAYLYTLLQSRGESAHYTELYGRLESAEYLGTLVAYLLAALCIQFGYNVVLQLSIGIGIVPVILLAILPGDSDRKKAKTSPIRAFKIAHKKVGSSTTLVAIIASIALLGGFIGTLEEYVPLYYSWNGLSAQGITYVLLAALIFSSFISSQIGRFAFLRIWHINALLAFCGLVLLLSGIVGGTVAIIGIFVTARSWYALQTLQYTRLQTEIHSSHRATITSIATFYAEIFSILFLLCYWGLTKLVDTSVAVYVLGGVLLLGMLYLVYRDRRV